jgi:hypothetical protein
MKFSRWRIELTGVEGARYRFLNSNYKIEIRRTITMFELNYITYTYGELRKIGECR